MNLCGLCNGDHLAVEFAVRDSEDDVDGVIDTQKAGVDHEVVGIAGSPDLVVYSGEGGATISLAWIGNGGVMIFLAGVIGGLIQGASPADMCRVMGNTCKSMWKAITTIVFIIAVAKVKHRYPSGRADRFFLPGACSRGRNHRNLRYRFHDILRHPVCQDADRSRAADWSQRDPAGRGEHGRRCHRQADLSSEHRCCDRGDRPGRRRRQDHVADREILRGIRYYRMRDLLCLCCPAVNHTCRQTPVCD